MTGLEVKALQETFPWTKRIIMVGGVGGHVQVLDKNGAEVPLFVITDFLEFVTKQWAVKDAKNAETAQG